MASRPQSKPCLFYLVCFKYAPGNWQHMESFAAGAEAGGNSVRFVLSKRFAWMTGQYSSRATYVTLSDTMLSIIADVALFLLYRWVILWRMLRRDRPRAIILVMWHPLNAVFCLMAKLICASRTVVWLHEPYKEDKLAYGWKWIIFYIVEWLQTLAMPWLDDVVVHSETARRAFRKRYPKARQTLHVLPLQFRDRPGSTTGQRQVVSFLGKAEKAKGIDAFFELIETSSTRNLDWRFAIATCDDISARAAKMSAPARERLDIISEANLSDAVLRETASRSLAVLCLYTSSMQSGVVPVALMCGAPVVATDIEALRECIEQNRTGFFVPSGAGPDAVLDALDFISENSAELSENCRREFLATYDDRNWQAVYGWLNGVQTQRK
ncbi:MAG: glycosyltransferase family 4 protein [Planctomycetes bacterium]|nr:glycosyltransferase family 4 protein [Planctomycetota bacterium]